LTSVSSSFHDRRPLPGARAWLERQRCQLRPQPLAELVDLLGRGQVIGELAGQVEHPFGDSGDHPRYHLEGAGVVAHH